jgi:hypothetical protein
MAANQEIDALLQELGRLLALAPRSSDQVTEILEQLKRKGYTVRPPEAVPKPSEAASKPYRLDARDVAFLQSIGIDGTRKARRARRS